MIQVIECIPAGLLKELPTILTTDEFSRLLSLSRLEKLTTQGMTANYIRKIARQRSIICTVTEKGSICVVQTSQAPRGSVPVEQLDREILFHAARLSALVEDRQKTISFGAGLSELEEALDEEPVAGQALVTPPAQSASAEEFSLENVFGRKDDA